jgi:hypothetical protein
MFDKTFVRILKKSEDKSDFDFWQKQSYEARLRALESIREEYNNWKYGPKQGFKRVFKITKRA